VSEWRSAERAKERGARWQRLGELLQSAESQGLTRLSDKEIWKLSTLYRALMTHLALARSMGSPARELSELNRLATRAHALIYGRSTSRT